jgi:3-hydroxy-5-methyl-1-naphthoate 3-O-methyltransferase
MNEPILPLPPAELLDIASGYQRSGALFALVEFEVPTLLAKGPLELPAIALTLKLHPIAADRFLNSCVALGLLERIDGEFRNSSLADEFLVKGKPSYLGDQIRRYEETSYPQWSGLAENLRKWRPGATDKTIAVVDEQGRDGMRAQHNLALMTGQALARKYDFTRHSVMLDLGGGTAAMSIGICQVHPNLRSIVFDLPEICEIAREYIQDSGMRGRIEVRAGNFKEDSLPNGVDVVLLANLLSVASEDTNRWLLRRIYELLPTGGVCIISGWILDDTRTSPLVPVLFCLEDINREAPDVERTESTYRSWMEEEGFIEIRRSLYCPPTSLMTGKKGRG